MALQDLVHFYAVIFDVRMVASTVVHTARLRISRERAVKKLVAIVEHRCIRLPSTWLLNRVLSRNLVDGPQFRRSVIDRRWLRCGFLRLRFAVGIGISASSAQWSCRSDR